MNLNQLRTKLDQIDTQLLKLLNKRQQVITKVAKLKKLNHLKIHQPKRELEMIDQRLKKALKLNLNQSFIQQLFRLILNESTKLQRSLIK